MLANFESECRKWRQRCKLSQLDLALAADISQKHLSYLETGRSKPSRTMVIRLCEAMQLPLRDRNRFLQLAGFSAEYHERQLSDADMGPINNAIDAILQQHNPYIAVAVDKRWNLIKQNEASERFNQFMAGQYPAIVPLLQRRPLNLIELTLHPDGLQPLITNWPEFATMMRQRLEQELIACSEEQEHLRLSTLIQQLARQNISRAAEHTSLLPVVPLNLKIAGQQLSLFSVISTIGTPQDITADEIRIESFYPMDEDTKAFFNAIG